MGVEWLWWWRSDGGEHSVLWLLLRASAMATEGQKNEMGARGLSGRGQGVIRHALALLGCTGQGASYARHALAKCGSHHLKAVGHMHRSF